MLSERDICYCHWPQVPKALEVVIIFDFDEHFRCPWVGIGCDMVAREADRVLRVVVVIVDVNLVEVWPANGLNSHRTVI